MSKRLVTILILLLVSAGGCSEPKKAQTVEVRIHHSRFVPERIDVEAGSRVRFVIVNEDPIAHEFILGDEEVQDRHETGTEPHHGAVPGEVSVAAGSRAETAYEFSRSGTLIFGCHLPGHYAYGMKGEVRVG